MDSVCSNIHSIPVGFCVHYSLQRDVSILDDDADMDALSEFLVQTTFEEGLTEAHADKAIEALSISLLKKASAKA